MEGELAAARRKFLELSSQRSGRENRVEQAKERRLAIQAERAADLTAADQAAAEASRARGNQQYPSQRVTRAGRADKWGASAPGARRKPGSNNIIAQRSERQSQRAELDAQLRTLRVAMIYSTACAAKARGLFAGVRHVVAASHRGNSWRCRPRRHYHERA